MKRYIRCNDVTAARKFEEGDPRNLFIDAIENVLGISYLGSDTMKDRRYQHSEKYGEDIVYKFKRSSSRLHRLKLDIKLSPHIYDDVTIAITPMLYDMRKYLQSKYGSTIYVDPTYHFIDCGW